MAVFTIPKQLTISLLSQLEYLILQYLILLTNTKNLLDDVSPQKN